MERTNRAVTTRRSRQNMRNISRMYVDGNTVRKLSEFPEQYPEQYPVQRPRKKTAQRPASQTAARTRQLSREAARNREKAMSMGRGFVIFLAAVSVAVLLFCVNYLRLQSEKTAIMKSVASLESEWSELKQENDAYESQVESGTDLNEIKKIAIGQLGMNYPTDDQKKTYSVSSNSYVRQYQDVPDTN